MAQVLEPAVIVPADRLIVPEPEVAPDTLPLQELLRPGVLATTRPVGKVSETANPVSAVFPAGFVIVIVRIELTLAATLVGLKAFAIVGTAFTVRVAEAVNPLPPSFEVTFPVVLAAAPTVLDVTVAVTVQLVFGVAIAPLAKTSEVGVEEATEPPTHVVAAPV
jgi:hypothetical protein